MGKGQGRGSFYIHKTNHTTMAKYLTKTTLLGFEGKGIKTPAGKLVELDPKNPQHARLINGKSVELYVEPQKPEEVKVGK